MVLNTLMLGTILYLKKWKLLEQLKSDESANSEKEQTNNKWKCFEKPINSEKKYTEEDMQKCFEESRLTHPVIGFKHESFAKYLDSLKK